MDNFDFKKIKEILEDNAKLKNKNNKLKNQLKNQIDISCIGKKIKNLEIINKYLDNKLQKLKYIELQKLKYIEQQNKTEEEEIRILQEKKQQNTDAIKKFNLPIKKIDERFGIITTNFLRMEEDGTCTDRITVRIPRPPQNWVSVSRNSLNTNLLKNKNYDYCRKRNHPKSWDGNTEYKVLINTKTNNITYIFTSDENNIPFNLEELYND